MSRDLFKPKTLERIAMLALACLTAPPVVCSQAQRNLAPQPSVPQVTPEQYARAAALDRGQLLRKLVNGLVVPHWIGQSDDFWYKNGSPISYQYTIVDAATGKKRPAFDHDAIAKALSAATGAEIGPRSLPFDRLTFNETRDAIHVSIQFKDYDCQLKPARCTEAQPSVAPPELEIEGTAPMPPDYRPVNEGQSVSRDSHWGISVRAGNLVLRDMGTGHEEPLTTDGEPNAGYGIYPGGWKATSVYRERAVEAGHLLPPMSAYWSPDSRIFVVPYVDQRGVQDYPIVETVPGDGSFRPKTHLVRVPLVGEKPPTIEWHVFDVEKHLHLRLEFPYDKLLVPQQDMLAIRRTWWSENNRHLFAVAFGDNMESAFFFDADVVTGKVRTVIEEHMTPRMDLNSTSYNPPNVRITMDGKQIIWFSERDGWGHLYLYDSESGKLKNQITRGAWLVRDIISVDDKVQRIYFVGCGREPGNPYYRYLYRVNFDGTGLELLSPEPADHVLTTPWNDVLALDGAIGYDVVSPSGKYVVYNYSTPQQPTQTVIRSTSDGKLVATFEKADANALFAAGYKPPEEFVSKSSDGDSDLWCVFYKPSNFDPQKRYPVIDVQYASPLTAVVPRNFMMGIVGPSEPSSPSAFAELGFIVVVIDARGTAFRSRQFSQANFGKLNTIGLDDHVATIRQLAQKYSWIDVDRVGVIGRSYGGWTAFRAMLEFPDFFKVGVAGAPPGSLMNQYLDYHWTAFQGRPIYSNGTDLRPSPTQVPENYKATDGRQQASRLKGRLLVIMGELDENVLPGSTLQFLDALQRADKDFDLIYLANQNHYFTGNPYVTRRVWDFLERNLLGAVPPEYHF